MLQEVLAKKSLAPDRRREIVRWFQDQLRRSERRSCRTLRFHRRTHRYKSIRDDQVPLRKRIKEIAERRVHYGYRRIHVLLRRESWAINVERVHPLYRMEGLNLRSTRARSHVMVQRCIERPLASRPNEIWAMDSVSDALFSGKRFRALIVVDAYTDECPAIHADQGIKGEALATLMERLSFQRRTAPTKIRVDNGPDFA